MRLSFIFFPLSLFVIYSNFQEILSRTVTTQFNGDTSLGGHTCPVNNIVFELEKCMSDIHCLGAFYQPETLRCLGCSAENEAELLSTPSLSLYYERSETRTCSKNSCYLPVSAKQTWDAAKNHCVLLGGVLIDVESQEEQEFLNNCLLLNNKDIDTFWIGATDSENEDIFVWLDGSSVGYENWEPREPSNSFGTEHCVEMLNQINNKWNDLPCNYQLSSICEFK